MAGKRAYHFTREELADALDRAGGVKAHAARLLGCNEMTFARHWQAGELVRGPPEGHDVRGISTLYDTDGNVKAQWVKTRVDERQQRQAIEVVAKELARALPRQKPIVASKTTNKHLLNLYTLTDCHVGALAWDRETGENWDVEIAERTIVESFRLMVEGSPQADTAIVNQLGDFLHFDSLASITPTSGHLLDSDSRYAKVVEVAVRTLRAVVNIALERHRSVRVQLCEGNHDPAGSVWLRTLFAALYEKEKRVFVEVSPKAYLAHRHGKTMLAFHHGHLAKFDRLAGVFAAEYPEIWGQTTKRYCHTGHYHHSRVLETAGMVIEQHPTLAARDAYAARLGLHAMRRVEGITYHDAWGQVGRVTVSPEMVK